MQTKAVHSIGLENQLVEILIPWLSQGKLVTEVDQRVYVALRTQIEQMSLCV